MVFLNDVRRGKVWSPQNGELEANHIWEVEGKILSCLALQANVNEHGHLQWFFDAKTVGGEKNFEASSPQEKGW